MKDFSMPSLGADMEGGTLVEWFKAPATNIRLYHMNRRLNLDCWLRSGFKSPRGRLVVSLFQDPISYGRFTVETLYVPCFDKGLKIISNYPIKSKSTEGNIHKLSVTNTPMH